MNKVDPDTSTAEVAKQLAAITETAKANAERLDRLEHLIDTLESWVSLDLRALDRYTGRFENKDHRHDYARTYRSEVPVLNPLDTDHAFLTYVLSNEPDMLVSHDPRPYVAGCQCHWTAAVGTMEEGVLLATDHAGKEHQEFTERWPELVGPELPTSHDEVTEGAA